VIFLLAAIVAPVLQQLESSTTQDISVNDCFKPVSRYWDRIERPEQILTSLPDAVRVLTSQADTGAVVVSLPQDVQAEAFEYPSRFFEKRVWTIPRQRCDRDLLVLAAQWIRSSKKPLIVAGGGGDLLRRHRATGALCRAIPHSGGRDPGWKGFPVFRSPAKSGRHRVTGTPGANICAREADLVIALVTRYSDFTTASKTAFQNPNVRFININVTELDAYKHSALASRRGRSHRS